MNKKRKIKIKKQAIFNCVSIIIIFTIGAYYLWRLIHFKVESEKEIILSDILAERLVERIDKYEINSNLDLTNNIYRFTGDVNDNYVRFMGYTWRIVKINEDKSITMISEDAPISLAYGNVSKYDDSQINEWLNKKENVEYTGIFYDMISENKDFLVNSRTCNDVFNDIETIGCFESNYDNLISLLSVKDYALAGGADSYLNNGTYFWTTNTNKDNEIWYISEDGNVGVVKHDVEYGVRPVITLKPGTKVISGTGISDDPYIISKKTVETLKDIYIGDYIILNDTLWRVVYKGTRSLKVVSEDYLTDSNGEVLLIDYSEVNNLSKTTDKTSLFYYLNSTYYKKFKEKDLLIKGPFYNGTYNSAGKYDYKTTYNSKVNAYVGLLSLAEPFVYDFGNIFTVSRNIDNDLSIFIINEDKLLFEDAITNKHAVRPAVYVNSDTLITGGNGTYLSPYTIGSEEIEEGTSN